MNFILYKLYLDETVNKKDLSTIEKSGVAKGTNEEMKRQGRGKDPGMIAGF